MARRRKTIVDAEKAESRKRLADFCGPPKKERKKPKYGSVSPSRVKMIRKAVREMMDNHDWSDAQPMHFVGLFDELHVWTYKVESGLSGKDYAGAISSARKMYKDEFGNSTPKMLAYLRWIWKREVDREKWRRRNNKSGGVLTWRQAFTNRSLLTQYKIDKQRKNGET